MMAIQSRGSLEMADPVAKPPRAFLSYSFDGPEHREWVLGLATRLREDGVETILDKWELEPGDSIPEFAEKAVRDNDFVLIICTPRYKERSDGRVGGVGYEGDIITAEVFIRRNQRKFKPVLRAGNWHEAAPTWLQAKAYVDLRGEPYSEQEYRRLLQSVLKIRAKAPSVRPSAVNMAPVESSEADPEQSPRRSDRSLQLAQHVAGDHNVVAGGDVNINKREVTRVSVTPGPEHITEGQARRLKDLVDKVAKVEIDRGSNPSQVYQRVWSGLTKHYQVASYRLIPRRLGDEAIKWLQQRAAMLRPKLRRTNPSAWQREHYTAIYARAHDLGMSKGEVYSLVKARLGLQVISLRQLGEQNLKRFYNIMMKLSGRPEP
jgi:hypothetical protein